MTISQPIISVGNDNCDIRGFTRLHLQSAVDHVATLGGGTVRVSAGVFQMDNALQLRDNVTVQGTSPKTILRKTAMRRAKVASILGFGHNDIITDQPDLFKVGDGILISSPKSGGFSDTTGTLTRREGDTWFFSRTHNMDYNESASVSTLHPLVEAVDVSDAGIEDLVLDGSSAQNGHINGCRGSAFYALRADRITARRIVARDFNGDGFSFQTCDDMTLLDCVAEDCLGNGFHPGSGSNRYRIAGCAARGCHESGLFYCLRVRDSILEDSIFENNRGPGIFIWARDDRHINRRLTIRRNGGCGIAFMDVPPTHASSDHVFENCLLEENCATDGEAEVLLQGHARNIRLTGLRIRQRPGKVGILATKTAGPYSEEDCIITSASG